ncbi:MAG: hypothetical protein ACOYMH_00110 [Zwartia sp.]
MRYYEVIITPLNGAPIIFSTNGSAGIPNGSALRVDFDIYQQFASLGNLSSFIRIYGISYKQISQLANLNPKLPLSDPNNFAKIQISAGMSKGLPFAKPAQQGIIIKGSIGQAFANWQGTEISLDLVIIPEVGSPTDPVNIPFSWKKGNTLESAVRASLGIAYPNTSVLGSYSSDLVYTEDQAGFYYDIEQFSKYVYNTSKSIITKPNYIGALITKTSAGYIITDGTKTTGSTIQPAYTDIIGNLTWLKAGTIQAKLVMRADLSINQKIRFPQGSPITNTVNSFSQYRNNPSQQGEFLINELRHVGSSRQASADNWATIVNCIEIPS